MMHFGLYIVSYKLVVYCADKSQNGTLSAAFSVDPQVSNLTEISVFQALNMRTDTTDP